MRRICMRPMAVRPYFLDWAHELLVFLRVLGSLARRQFGCRFGRFAVTVHFAYVFEPFRAVACQR